MSEVNGVMESMESMESILMCSLGAVSLGIWGLTRLSMYAIWPKNQIESYLSSQQ